MRTGQRVLIAVVLLAIGVVVGTLLTGPASSGDDPLPHLRVDVVDGAVGSAELSSVVAQPREPVVSESEVVDAGQRPESNRSAWIQDGSEIQVRGRTPEQVMRDWHGGDWALVEEAILETLNDPDAHGLDRPLEADSVGDVDGCLERAPELALRWYDDGPGPLLIRYFPGSRVSATLPAETLAKRFAMDPTLDVGAEPFDTDHPDWYEFVLWVAAEREVFVELADSLVDAQRDCISDILGRTTRFDRPSHGELYLAPFATPHAPGIDPSAPEYQAPDGTVLLFGEGTGPCRYLGGIFYLSFLEVPSVAGVLADWKSYRAAVAEDLEVRLSQLPRL